MINISNVTSLYDNPFNKKLHNFLIVLIYKTNIFRFFTEFLIHEPIQKLNKNKNKNQGSFIYFIY